MPADLVVIGCSWGGMRAVKVILDALPKRFGAAVVIAQHRSATSTGGLAGIIGQGTALPVTDAEDKEALVRGHVYLAPPDYHLLVERGTLALSVDERVQYSRPSIDVLFESAADAYGRRVVGVILTGANDDGAAGLLAIRRAGGFTMLQDPADA